MWYLWSINGSSYKFNNIHKVTDYLYENGIVKNYTISEISNGVSRCCNDVIDNFEGIKCRYINSDTKVSINENNKYYNLQVKDLESGNSLLFNSKIKAIAYMNKNKLSGLSKDSIQKYLPKNPDYGTVIIKDKYSIKAVEPELALFKGVK